MEDEFWEVTRSESGQLDRICMDYQLRDRGIEDAGLRRILRGQWRLMNAKVQEQRRKKLEEIKKRGAARH